MNSNNFVAFILLAASKKCGKIIDFVQKWGWNIQSSQGWPIDDRYTFFSFELKSDLHTVGFFRASGSGLSCTRTWTCTWKPGKVGLEFANLQEKYTIIPKKKELIT